MRSTRRSPARLRERASLRRGHDQARRPDHPGRRQSRHSDGEFIGMLGANGAGKTTLMRAALGLVPVSAGAIRVLGRPATRGNAVVGYIPQKRGESGRPSAQRLRHGRQRRRRRRLGPAAPRRRRRAATSTARSISSARARSARRSSTNSPAASASACCSRRRCSGARTAAARRAADQPRSRPPARGGRTRRPPARRIQDRDRRSAPTNSIR